MEDIFREEPIYSKPIDVISIASGSSTQYEEPWSDPDIEIGEAFETEFSTTNTPKQIEPSASPLSVFSTFSSNKSLNSIEFKQAAEEREALEVLDQAIEDSGYSSPSISRASSHYDNDKNRSGNNSQCSSRYEREEGSEYETPFQAGHETDSSNFVSSDTSSSEYDLDADIRSYENVPPSPCSKKLKTRRQRAAGSRYSYKDIGQGLANLDNDSDTTKVESEQWSDEWSASEDISDLGTDGYATTAPTNR
ncbi:hypothetical protein [Rickettsia amblyommatis]|uniref:Cell surface antigen Sca12 n=2 Tax=Rickettsia amblyommatis TaxID=33989 RepID=H8K6A7_RICAG|nr:hypothetical protein [Rickettsia amblyommatis]ADD14603.1 cell surface antigen Sca12 [Rickettsia amblyommatis str. AaR/SC]AFC70418.1 cell surface antigen Sca12 [Rickettsia amblyommatis str. GAT-30V]KJV99914.1 putative cell surface antigen Sca12 [Rickettsia amblyommatis str. Darkwater]